MKKELLTTLKKEVNRAIEEATAMIKESAEKYAETMVMLELGMIKGEEVKSAKAEVELLIIQGRLTRRTIEALEKTLDEIDSLIGEETEEDEVFGIDAETMAEALKLFAR